MKTKILLSLLLSLNFCLLSSQIPQGFNYQAIARDASGNPILNTPLPVRITIQSDSLGGTICWIEEHSSVTTNGFGVFTLVLGKGARQTGSTVATFNDIDWKVTPKYIKTEIYYQAAWKNMGSARLWSVPYSVVSGGLSGSLNKLTVKGDIVSTDSTLFEVKNNNGQTIFAVYPEGVRIFVDDGVAKGAKGGFAIGGFGTAKAASQEYFRVTSDSTRVYVKNAAKGTKGGFAIGGYSAVKGLSSFYVNMTPDNYFIGEGSGTKTTTGQYNSFIGYNAGMQNTTGGSNVFLGNESGKSNTDGNSNLFLGYQSGYSNLTGNSNLFVGYQSGYWNSSGNDNTFLGFGSGYSNTTGFGNLFIGRNSGSLNSTGNYNTFIGYNTGINTSTGGDNTFIGYFAGFSNTVGANNIFIGRYAGGSNVDGTENLFIGSEAGYSNSNGYMNIFLGRQTGRTNTTGVWNMFLGNGSGWNNTIGNGNMFVGHSAGNNNTVGGNNICLGIDAGFSNLTGNNNTYVGDHCGYSNLSGTGNVFLGYYAGYSETGSNKLFISNSPTTTPLIGGDFSAGMVGINRKPTTYTLEVGGTIWANGSTISSGANTWSDLRYKDNITDLSDPLGTILQLHGVKFDWATESFPELNFPAGRQIGVIAQEVEKILPELVYTDAKGYKSVSYEKFSAVLIEAVKEQQKQILGQQKEIDELKALVNSLITNQSGHGNK